MKKILIISNSYPNYGGQSTTAYNLLKLLANEHYDVRLLCINNLKNSDTDPEKTGMSHKIVMQKDIASRVYSLVKKIGVVTDTPRITKIKQYYFFLRLMPKLIKFQVTNNFYPDLVITNIPSYCWMIKRIFGSKKMLVIIGSSPEMNRLAKQNIDASYVFKDPTHALQLLKGTNDYDFRGTNLLFNSQLTKQIYSLLKIEAANSFVQYFNIAPLQKNQSIEFNARKYDIAFIASDFSRNIKNVVLTRQIFEQFSNRTKIAIGKSSHMFADIQNTEVSELITQQDILNILANTRLLIITSYFDSSPSVLSEAVINGCNVLISKNVGWSEMLGNNSVVDDYSNIDEWIQKAGLLLQTKQHYTQFEHTISNAKADIKTLIDNIISGIR
ncbi:MAG: hypothetical protein JST82_16700 [Bacteroidetes bacterium]|nr:hypothetical protein [Bacteroidota bacterium]